MRLANNVLARYLRALDDQSVRDIQTNLAQFDRLVAQNEEMEKKLEEFDGSGDPLTPYRGVARINSTFTVIKQLGFSSIFLNILKGFQLDKADRKVIEQAAKQFAKTRQGKVPVEKIKEVYPAYMANLRAVSAVCHRVLAQNKHHKDETGTATSETVIKAGPFNLINTGGFSEKAMEEAARVCIEAARRLTAQGLGRVCYGDIQVTNTVGRSTRVLAFYMVKSDEMYVRANLKGKAGPACESVMHELGHRLQFKFLSGKKQEIDSIYRTLDDKDDTTISAVRRNPELHPKPGDTISDSAGVITATGMYRDLAGNAFVLAEQKSKKFKVALGDWLKYKHTSFVSTYARTSPEENFAEMVASLGMGTLPKDQEAMLSSITGH